MEYGVNHNPVQWTMSPDMQYVSLSLNDEAGNPVHSFIHRDQLVGLVEWFKFCTEEQTVEQFLGLDPDSEYTVEVVDADGYLNLLDNFGNPEN